ncbi:MAG TPA: pyridoxal-dependent decarboxylase [Candidatus Sulfotelmatobacter sp.]|nr:pyridoxal-dependent decarboxylase [Candidatus Sulfotelmatobacter sp.]
MKKGPKHSVNSWNSGSEAIEKLWDPVVVRKMARELADIAADGLLHNTGEVRTPPCERVAATIIKKAGNPDLISLVRDIQRSSLHLSHPRFAAQQVAAPIPAAALVESVVAALNQSLAVWEMSPLATPIDRDLVNDFKKLFGYPRTADGSFVPGGAFSNLTALLAARDALEPKAAKSGQGRIGLIVGAQAHYSVARSAAILGLGRDAVFRVPLNLEFSTDVERTHEAFAAARRAGFRKFILIGSSGSTPTGSFDDLVALRQIATKYRAWLHVDAAHGGGLAFSRKYRKQLRGIDRPDSITFDPHKMMFMPLSAGGVLVRHGSHLAEPLHEQAPYLFGSTRRWPDIGQVTIACSQRFDALKTWIVWRAYGSKIWDTLATHVCDVAQAAFHYCAESAALQPVHQPQSNIFCFRLRCEHGRDVDRRHWAIKEEINESGFAYISSTVLDGRRVLRLVVMNPRTTVDHIRAILHRVEEIATRHGWA